MAPKVEIIRERLGHGINIGHLEEWRQRYKDVPILPLDDLRRLPRPRDFDAGVYFLWDGPELAYIGKSGNIPDRLYYQATMNRYYIFWQTARAKQIPFDSVTCIVFENSMIRSREVEQKMEAYERAYIVAYQPLANADAQPGVT